MGGADESMEIAWSRHGVGGADQGMVEDGKIKAWVGGADVSLCQ